MNDAEENLNLTIFDVFDSTIIFCELQHAWNGRAPAKCIALNVNTI